MIENLLIVRVVAPMLNYPCRFSCRSSLFQNQVCSS